MKKNELRENFLKEFTKSLLRESLRRYNERLQMEMVRVPQFVTQKPIEAPVLPPTIVRKKTIIKHPALTPSILKPKTEEITTFASPPPTAPIAAPAIQPLTHREVVNLARIEQFLVDPAVLSVECTGPSKALLINRGGIIQATALALTANEINNIMNEISERTRIPLVPGIFKAIFGNYMVSAVISEFAGTRFILQKRYYPVPSRA